MRQTDTHASPHLSCTLKPVLSCKLVRLVLCVPAQLNQEMVRDGTVCGLRGEQQRIQQHQHPSRRCPVSGRPAHRVRLLSVRPFACSSGGGWGVERSVYGMLLAREEGEEEEEDARIWRGGRIKASPRRRLVRPVEVGFRRGGAAQPGWFELRDVVWSQSCILSFLSLLLLSSSHP